MYDIWYYNEQDSDWLRRDMLPPEHQLESPQFPRSPQTSQKPKHISEDTSLSEAE
jgi:hypothetical protein